ncbi:hypothetical protein KBC03_00405 [Patescibacteria group bacterium]|nr:hypothetical protein [Patescibacteria group bacterium]
METPIGKQFLYYSDRDYPIGAILFVAGSLQEATGETNLLRRFSWEEISKRAQILSDEEWGFDKNRWLLMRGRQGSLYEKEALIIGRKPVSYIASRRQNLIRLMEKSYDRQTL